MKIIQLLPMPNDFTYQGVVFGLGDDGKVYSWKSLNGKSGWFLEMDNVLLNESRGKQCD